MMSKSKIYLPLLILGTAFWGISFPLSKDAFQVIHPYTFMFYRFLIAAALLTMLFYKKMHAINKSTLKKGLLSGFFLFMGIGWQTVGLKYTNASNASFIAGIEVVLIPLFAFLFFKKSVQPKIWFACVLALIGLYTIAATSGISHLKTGDMMVFVGSLFYAAYVLYVGKVTSTKQSGINTVAFVVIQLFVCSLSAGVLTVSTQGLSAMSIPLSWDLWEVLLFVGILSTAYMYCVQNVAQKYIEAEKIALTYLCEPVFATLFAFFLLNEDITQRTIIGGSLIISAMLVSEVNLTPMFKRVRNKAVLVLNKLSN